TGGSSADTSLVWEAPGSRVATVVCSVISGSSSFIQSRLVHSGSKRPRSLHRNAARHGFGAPRNGDMEHAVAIICGYCVGIHILGQADRTAKTPGETLIDVDHGPVTLGRHRRGALPGD